MLATTLSSPLPLPGLAIAGRAGHAFTPEAMLQGFACHARGVELAASGPSRVHARVRSKRVHDVLLRAEDGRLAIACTCPARSLGIDFCKHAWAALLEVDRADALADLRHGRGPLVLEVAVPAPAEATEKKPAKEKAKVKPAPAPQKAVKRDARRASPRSPRANAAPPAARGSRRPRPR